MNQGPCSFAMYKFSLFVLCTHQITLGGLSGRFTLLAYRPSRSGLSACTADVTCFFPAGSPRRLVVAGVAGSLLRRRRRLLAADREHERAHGHVVVDGEQQLERVDDVAHAGARLGHALQALVRHLRGGVRGARRVLQLEAGVHDAVQPVGAAEVGARPVHEVLLPAAPPLSTGGGR